MRVESYLVAELLQRMEQQNAALRPFTVDLVTNLNADDFSAALDASMELHRVLDSLVATRALLEDYVVAHDGMGAIGDSVGELALRARALLLTSEFDMLRQAIDDPAVHARSRNWFSGKFQSIADMIAFVRDGIAQVHAIWMPYRRDQRELPGITTAQRANVYRTMIQVAECTLRDLLREQELARFLARGAAANDLPELHLRCKRIVHVLRTEIDIDPAARLTRRPRRMLQAGGETEP